MTQTGRTAGKTIGKYVLKREIGRGGMGAVYLAEQTALGREVAIKELIPSAVADPTALARFMQEAQVMARASHPNIIQVHDLERTANASYLVLEYVKGRSLRERLNAGALSLAQTFAVMKGLLEALDYAHRHNIVHRDVKPENVLISDEGEVKVADFGIARLVDDPGASPGTKAGTTLGTPQYMSPEQVSSAAVDGRSDLYSAGIMLYELVCGRPPFTAGPADGPFTLLAKHAQAPPPPPTLHRPGLDHDLERVMLKALAKRPDGRYQTAAGFAEDLARVADRIAPGWEESLQPAAAPPSAATSAQPLAAAPVPPKRRKPVSPALVGVVALVLFSLLGGIAYVGVGSLLGSRSSPSTPPSAAPSPAANCDFMKPGSAVGPGLGARPCPTLGSEIVDISFGAGALPAGVAVQALELSGKPVSTPPPVPNSGGAAELTAPVNGYELAVGTTASSTADAVVVADFTPVTAGDADFGLALRCTPAQCLKVAVSPKGRYVIGDYTLDGKPVGAPLAGEARVTSGQAERLVVFVQGASVEAWLDGDLLARAATSTPSAPAAVAFIDLDNDTTPATVRLSRLYVYEVSS
jgi:serine/threonine-protein kinase